MVVHKGKKEISMSKSATHYIKTLEMTAHPEGGYYAQTYSSPLTYDTEYSTRPLATSIYFLLADKDVSRFHQLKSDELWYFHDGEPLDVYMILPTGDLVVQTLGLDLEKGQRPQILVPAGAIFGSCIKEENTNHFSLVGCVVSYGFHFEDFKLFSRKELLEKYPQHEKAIIKLT